MQEAWDTQIFLEFNPGLLKNFYANNYMYNYGKIPFPQRTD
jgi:hypothetical protein